MLLNTGGWRTSCKEDPRLDLDDLHGREPHTTVDPGDSVHVMVSCNLEPGAFVETTMTSGTFELRPGETGLEEGPTAVDAVPWRHSDMSIGGPSIHDEWSPLEVYQAATSRVKSGRQ
jgi:hypothetical protein